MQIVKEAVIKYKFRGNWATMRCLRGNVDMILRHFTADKVTAVAVAYETVKIRSVNGAKKI